MPASLKLSIVIPVYNEESFIDAILERVRAVRFQEGVEVEYIAVDDHSTDKTWEKLQAWESRGVKIKRHEVNGGKGAALHTGFDMATGDVVTIQDADFEYSPEELPAVLQPILDGQADVVFGARKPIMRAAGSQQVMGFWHAKINEFLTHFSNMFSDLALFDMECCYKMARRDFLKRIKLQEKRFGFEPEFTLKIARLHPRVWQVPVSYAPRSYKDGKKINWKDGVSAFRCILQYGLFRL
jgi:glycosyltransferase involved in cell wall biosynthesis